MEYLEVLLSSSDSDDDEEEELIRLYMAQVGKKPKVQNFVDLLLENTDIEFKKHLRVTKESFEILVLKFENSLEYTKMSGHGGSPAKCPRLHVSAFLWFAGNKATLRTTSLLFDTSVSTMFNIIRRVLNFLLSIGSEIIKFPSSQEEIDSISTAYENISGFPGILGSIDGTYINMSTPAHKLKSTYVNRHQLTSITLQAVCDSNKKFLDVFTGVSGKVHDARIYQMSFLKPKIDNLEAAYHIIGDAAYPLSENLLTPYRDYGNMTNKQKIFNKKFCQCRVKIENAFGLLKGRFRQLLHVDFWSVAKVAEFVIGCCILHNICIDNNDLFEEHEEDLNNNDIADETTNERDRLLRRLGELKRDRIADLFS